MIGNEAGRRSGHQTVADACFSITGESEGNLTTAITKEKFRSTAVQILRQPQGLQSGLFMKK